MLAITLMLGALAVSPRPASAQSCFGCDDENWTEVSCVAQGWEGFGYTECEVHYDPPNCAFGTQVCWGPDPEDQQLAALTIRADGTFVLPAEEAPSPSLADLAMEPYGFSETAHINERTCKGLITGRVYGELVRRQLKQRTQTLII